MERGELQVVDAIPFADVYEVVPLFCEEQVAASGGAHVADAVAAVEEGSPGSRVRVVECCGMLDALVLVVAEAGVVSVNDVPGSGAVGGLDVVGVDLDERVELWAEELFEERFDDDVHAAGHDDERDVVGDAPLDGVREARVELDVLEQVLDAVGQGVAVGGDGAKHEGKRVPEGEGAVEDPVVERHALGVAHAEVVGQKVVRVLEGDGAVPVGEDDCTGWGHWRVWG